MGGVVPQQIGCGKSTISLEWFPRRKRRQRRDKICRPSILFPESLDNGQVVVVVVETRRLWRVAKSPRNYGVPTLILGRVGSR